MKTYGGNGGINTPFFNSTLVGGGQLHAPRERATVIHLIEGWVGPATV
jgi:hypothetical protein